MEEVMGATTTTTPETQPAATETKAAVVDTKPASSELKVVIIVKNDRIMMAVQSPECDPVYETMEGDLGAALARAPMLVNEATVKWATAKRYPKADIPAPPPPPPRAATTTPAHKPAAAPKPSPQPKMF